MVPILWMNVLNHTFDCTDFAFFTWLETDSYFRCKIEEHIGKRRVKSMSVLLISLFFFFLAPPKTSKLWTGCFCIFFVSVEKQSFNGALIFLICFSENLRKTASLEVTPWVQLTATWCSVTICWYLLVSIKRSLMWACLLHQRIRQCLYEKQFGSLGGIFHSPGSRWYGKSFLFSFCFYIVKEGQAGLPRSCLSKARFRLLWSTHVRKDTSTRLSRWILIDLRMRSIFEFEFKLN